MVCMRNDHVAVTVVRRTVLYRVAEVIFRSLLSCIDML